MPDAEILHADGTPCAHQGRGQARDGQYQCPAGHAVTHVRYRGRTVELAAAVTAVTQLAATFVTSLAAVTGLIRELDRVMEPLPDPRWRVLAAAIGEAEAIEAQDRR